MRLRNRFLAGHTTDICENETVGLKLADSVSLPIDQGWRMQVQRPGSEPGYHAPHQSPHAGQVSPI